MADEHTSVVDLTIEELERRASFLESLSLDELVKTVRDAAGYSLPGVGNAMSTRDYYQTAKTIASGQGTAADFVSLPLDVLGIVSPVRLPKPAKADIVIGPNDAALSAKERRDLADARNLFDEYKGKKRSSIEAETGWGAFPGSNSAGMYWGKEISDKSAALNQVYMDKMRSLLEDASKKENGSVTGQMGGLLEHDDLYKRYPHLRESWVSIDPKDVSGGAKILSNGNVTVSRSLFEPNKKASLRRALLHELQHGVASKETNGSMYMGRSLFDASELRPDSWPANTIGRNAGKKPNGSVDWEDYVQYTFNPGEMMARLTEMRSDMTPAQLKQFSRFRAHALQQRLMNNKYRDIIRLADGTPLNPLESKALMYPPSLFALSPKEQDRMLELLLTKE